MSDFMDSIPEIHRKALDGLSESDIRRLARRIPRFSSHVIKLAFAKSSSYIQVGWILTKYVDHARLAINAIERDR